MKRRKQTRNKSPQQNSPAAGARKRQLRGSRPAKLRLLHEAMTGVMQKSSRLLMTVIGIALGVGSLISILGITASANAQISSEFLKAESTQIKVEPLHEQKQAASLFSPSADNSVAELNGVTAVGRWWTVQANAITPAAAVLTPSEFTPQLLAATPGYWNVVDASLSSGRLFDEALNQSPVAVLGESVAVKYGITSAADDAVIVIDNVRFSVIGIISGTASNSAVAGAITIPAAYALVHFASPGERETMVVDVVPGGAETVASQIALSIDPFNPESYRVTPPPKATVVRDRVSSSTQALFYALAGIGVIASGVGIANVSLLGVIARTREIALRRSLGAMPQHIAAQFILEAAVRGLIGGSVGTALAVASVVIIAVAQQWTAVIEPLSLLLGPLLGLLVGTAAGLYPAIRATKIAPVEAFRR